MLTFYSTLQKQFCYVSFENGVELCYCVGNASFKKCVLSRDLNFLMSLGFLVCSGRSVKYFATA